MTRSQARSQFVAIERSAKLLAPLAMVILATACAEITMAWAPMKPGNEPALPQIAAPASILSWQEETAPLYKRLLEENVYGRMPDASRIEIIDRRVVASDAFEGLGTYEEIRIRPYAAFNGIEATAPDGEFIVALVTPNGASGPSPVIMMETFCDRWSAAPNAKASRPGDAQSMGGFVGALATYVFGRYICTPPFESILAEGYAVAVIHPGELVPDVAQPGRTALQSLAEGIGDDRHRWGAIAAWGWMFSRVVDVLEADVRLDQNGFIAWGHSRYGKAALVAAAYDERIDAVISHQSGTGGASLNWNKRGESIGSIVDNYPHWFSATYGGLDAASEGEGERPPFDQHMLLALIAPRPILLGNARRDVWSDPEGAFRAARGATPAYAALGSAGMRQTRLDAFDPAADIAFWMRPGTHGVVEEDWPAFMEFLNAHFKTSAKPSMPKGR
ncbi:MAG: hypothetical protein GC152_01080 [Alphaproteobacteria bacterium]|nr:hypothetical protein [Alphaproteobacteria bacterium]